MKTLIVIVSIILLSYQIDRFFTKDRAIAPVEVQKNEVKEFQQVQPEELSLPSKKQTEEAQDVSLTKADIPVSNVTLVANETTLAKVSNAVTKETKTTHGYRLKQVSKINQHAKIFHSRMKESGNYLSLNTVQFNYNKFDVLASEDFNAVMQFADLLIFDETLKVSVAGFTDNIGDSTYNEQLSLMRAIHVQNYLVDLGVNEDQILVSAYGVENPVADNKTKEGRALNRRVELVLISQQN